MDMKKQAINHEVNCLFYSGAANEARTRDPQLGKLMLYQLSYCRRFYVPLVCCGLVNIAKLDIIFLSGNHFAEINWNRSISHWQKFRKFAR